MDLIELNEAFAAQVLAVLAEWGMDVDRRPAQPVNGSGISLGHPIGATGARILTTMLHELDAARGPLRPGDDVHGFPDTSRVWDEVRDRLVATHRVVTYDVRGTGDSDVPAGRDGYRFERLADDLVAVADLVSPGEPVHVVGHDWGAIQAFEAATSADHAARLASFTCVSGASFDHVGRLLRHHLRPSPRPWEGLSALASQVPRSWYVYLFQVPWLPEQVFRSGLGARMVRRLEPLEPREGHPADSFVSDAANGVNLYRANLGRVLRPRRDHVHVPIQVVVGDGDPFASTRLFDQLVDLAPQAWLRVVHGGHWLPRSHPDTVVEAVRALVEHVDEGSEPPPCRPPAWGRTLPGRTAPWRWAPGSPLRGSRAWHRCPRTRESSRGRSYRIGGGRDALDTTGPVPGPGGRRRVVAVVGLRRGTSNTSWTHASDLLLVVHHDGFIGYCSPPTRRYVPATGTPVHIASLAHRLDPNDVEPVLEAWSRVQGAPGIVDHVQVRVRRDDGRMRVLAATLSNLSHVDPGPGVVVNARDITDELAVRARFEDHLVRDGLTGLANRPALLDDLRRRSAAGPSFALVLVDVIGMSGLNDRSGTSRSTCCCGRWPSGWSSRRRARCPWWPAYVRRRVRHRGPRTSRPSRTPSGPGRGQRHRRRTVSALPGGGTIALQLRVGVAWSAQSDGTPGGLLTDADLALSDLATSHEPGGAGVRRRAAAAAPPSVAARARAPAPRRARPAGPAVPARGGPAHGAGAAAWRRWSGGSTRSWGGSGPSEFIPVAEHSGVIVPIGRWVLQEATRQLARWRRAGLAEGLCMAVNASACELLDVDLPATVAAAVAAAGIAPDTCASRSAETALADELPATTHVVRVAGRHGGHHPHRRLRYLVLLVRPGATLPVPRAQDRPCVRVGPGRRPHDGGPGRGHAVHRARAAPAGRRGGRRDHRPARRARAARLHLRPGLPAGPARSRRPRWAPCSPSRPTTARESSRSKRSQIVRSTSRARCTCSSA